MSDLTEKLEIDVEIKGSADEFYTVFSKKAHDIPKICPDTIHEIEVHEGDWETPGSVKKWNYTHDGKTMAVKETVEVDEENKKVIFHVLEGDLMEHHEKLKVIVHADPKKDGPGGIVKWTLEYEKKHADVPTMHSYLDLAKKLTNDIDDHLVKA